MKIYVLITLFVSFFLVGCSDNEKDTIMKDTSIVWNVENESESELESESESELENNFVDNINKGETSKENIDKIIDKRNSSSEYNFYMLDCEKEYATNEEIKLCQKLSLKESLVWCDSLSKELEWWLNKLFNIEKFSLIDSVFVNEAKKYCTDYIKNEKQFYLESEKFANKMEEYDENLEKFEKTFDINKCSVYSKKEFIEKQEEWEINKFLTEDILELRCKMIYWINKWCDKLDGDLQKQCEDTQNQIQSDLVLNPERDIALKYNLAQYAQYDDILMPVDNIKPFYDEWNILEKMKNNENLREIISW